MHLPKYVMLILCAKANAIMGKWIALPNQNLIVEVHNEGKEYRARIVWFDDTDNLSRPMHERMDAENPDKDLRRRKILGLEVLKKLVYNPGNSYWEDGKIYDPTSGKEWSASVKLINENLMELRGYWLFKFFGKSMNFKRI